MTTAKTISGTTIILIKTNDGVQVTFNSAISKELFVKTHTQGTYTMYRNYAIVDRYLVIDTEGTGWILANSGISYEEALNLIQHYL